jgi:cold shock CspA family protein
MGRSQETFNKKEVRTKKEKKRTEPDPKRRARKEGEKKGGLDEMIAYVDENGMITDTPPDPEKKTKVKAEDIVISVPIRDDSEESSERRGTVAHFNDSKGYGFIRDAETRESVFVHESNTLEPIKEGNLVSFELEKGPKGLTAVGVKIVK